MRRLILLCMLAGCRIDNMQNPGQSFLGAPYIVSPLGEERAPDYDPLIRFDGFDCTTLVETVLADGDLMRLNKIRYKDGKIDFVSRNHFIETDWLTNNSDLVHNASAKYATPALRHVIIDKKAWFKRVHNMETDFVPQVIDFEYIPFAQAKQIHVSKPVIVLFVADNPKIRDKIGTDLAVVHMGFLLPDGTLRHASSQQKQVVDVRFDEYIDERQKNKNNLGIAIVEIK